MPKVPTAKATRAYEELARFASRQDVTDALEKAASDQALYRKAKADPKSLFRSEGIKLPAHTEIAIARRATGISGQITICVQICRRIGRFTFCVQICGTIVF